MQKVSVLFVCLGNICRSPLAEGVFRMEAEKQGLGHVFKVDSAGTHGYHTGSLPDIRSRQVAQMHNIELLHKARTLHTEDLTAFQYIFLMDQSNLQHARRLGKGNFYLARTFDPQSGGSLEVPDPYYGSEKDFAEVYEIVLRMSCQLLSNYKQFGTLTAG